MTAKDLLLLGPGASAAWNAWPAKRGEIPWMNGVEEVPEIGNAVDRFWQLWNEVYAAAVQNGRDFKDFASDEYEIDLTAFVATGISWEMVALKRIMQADYSAVTSVQPVIRPEWLRIEDVEDLRERLLAEADRLGAEAASVSDS